MDNPANQGTRGLKETEMTKKFLWLRGPQIFLFSKDNCTTDEQQHENVFLNSAEQKSQVTRRNPIDKDLIDANRFSQRLNLRAVIIKIENLRNKTKSRDQQITDAESFLFRLSLPASIVRRGCKSTNKQQASSEKEKIDSVDTFNRRRLYHSIKQQTSQRTSFNSNKKPITLDGRNRIIRRFLELQHNINGHVGVEQQIQLNYWVLQCKTGMKKISTRCYECRRQRQLNSQPEMSDLPSYRFSVKPVVFKETGVDFFWAF